MSQNCAIYRMKRVREIRMNNVCLFLWFLSLHQKKYFAKYKNQRTYKKPNRPQTRHVCAWLTFNFANGLRICSVSLLRCVPEILSIRRLPSGTNMPNGILVMSAIDSAFSSVRFWNTGRISNKFSCTFPLILSVCNFGMWHM